MQVAQVSAEATHELRRHVLRQGRADADVRFDGDEAEGTLHLAVTDDAGRCLAVATTSPRQCPLRAGRPAWKVRGMAVAPGFRRQGLGGRLLEEIEARALAAGVELLWADGRDVVLTFYRRHGWSVEGEGYITPATGLPHHTVIRDLATPA